MSKNAAALATPAPVTKADLAAREPAVSVAEAMGLPEDWSLASSLNAAGGGGGDPTKVETHEDDELPEEKTEPEPKAEEKPAGKEGDKPEGGKTEGQPTPKKKDEPEKKSEEKPEAEPAAAPAKIKIGGKEYTEDELKNLLEKPEPKPAAPAKAEPEKKELTPEEQVKQQAEVKKKDDDWVAGLAPHIDISVDEPTLEKILTGGPEAVKAFQAVLQSATARAILVTRKSMYAELEPRFSRLSDQQAPLLTAHEQAENERAWQEFQKEYDDLKEDRDLVEQAANVLATKDADRVSGLSEKEFYAECAQQVRTFKSRFVKAAPAAAAPAEKPEGGKPAEGAAAPAAKAKVKPPAGNLPAASGGKETKGKAGDSAIIATLW